MFSFSLLATARRREKVINNTFLPAIQIMRTRLQDDLHIVGIGKGSVGVEANVKAGDGKRQQSNSHETKSSGTSGLVVLHHHTVNDFAISTEVPLQAVLGRFPAEASDEEFSIKRRRGERSRKSRLGTRKFITKKKLSHHQKNERSGFHFWKLKVFFFFAVRDEVLRLSPPTAIEGKHIFSMGSVAKSDGYLPLFVILNVNTGIHSHFSSVRLNFWWF